MWQNEEEYYEITTGEPVCKARTRTWCSYPQMSSSTFGDWKCFFSVVFYLDPTKCDKEARLENVNQLLTNATQTTTCGVHGNTKDVGFSTLNTSFSIPVLRLLVQCNTGVCACVCVCGCVKARQGANDTRGLLSWRSDSELFILVSWKSGLFQRIKEWWNSRCKHLHTWLQ